MRFNPRLITLDSEFFLFINLLNDFLILFVISSLEYILDISNNSYRINHSSGYFLIALLNIFNNFLSEYFLVKPLDCLCNLFKSVLLYDCFL